MQSNREFNIEGVGLDVDTLPRPLDWRQVFGNDHPVELEIGTGKGTFLTEQAKARPDVNFFGLEWANWFFAMPPTACDATTAPAAPMARGEAGYFLTEFVADASVSVLHVYFPDPWPKSATTSAAWSRSRSCARRSGSWARRGRADRVGPQGLLRGEHRADAEVERRLQVVDYNRPGSAGEGEFVGTNFERKYRREGRPFYAWRR